MTMDPQLAQRIPEPVREPVGQYVGRIRELAGPNGLALTLYGAVLTPGFDRKRDQIRNVLVLERVDLEMLRRLAQEGARLGKAGISAPLVMTPSYIQASLDTFPLEILEIHQQHVTLFGEDHFAELSFTGTDLRLQCERELKTMLIGMRQGLLAAAGREKLFAEVASDVARGLMRVLRGMLWLKGQTEPRSADKVLADAEQAFSRTLQGVRIALDPAQADTWDSFRLLYEDITHLGDMADAW